MKRQNTKNNFIWVLTLAACCFIQHLSGQEKPAQRESKESAALKEAMTACDKKDYGAALILFNKYLDADLDLKNPDAIKNYITAVSNASSICIRKRDSAKTLQYLRKLDNLKTDSRELSLKFLALKLDILQKMKDSGMKEWQKETELTSTAFDKLKWSGQDAVSIFVSMEYARALYILENYDDALKALSGTPSELLKAFDEQCIQDGRTAESPVAMQKYMEGRILVVKAESSKDDMLRKKYFSESLKKFYVILTKYKGFAAEKDAMQFLLLCRYNIEKLGGSVKFPDNFDVPQEDHYSLTSYEMDHLFRNRKYDRVVIMGENLIKSGDKTPGIEESICRFAIACSMTKKIPEALAACRYLAENWPEAQASAAAVFEASRQLWDEGHKTDAASLCDYFLDKAAANKAAGDIALFMAQMHYRGAAGIMEKDSKAKLAAAQDSFSKAIVYLKLIIEKYSSNREIYVPSVFMLADSYINMNLYEDSEKIYTSFCAKENTDKVNILNAKIGIANARYQKGLYLAAKANSLTAATEKKASSDETLICYKKASEVMTELLNGWINSPEFKKFIAANPQIEKTIEKAFLLQAKILESASDFKEAAEVLRKLLLKYPDSERAPQYFAKLASLYYESGNIESSTKTIEGLTAKYPASPEAKNIYFSLARNLYESGNSAKAVEILNKLFAEKSAINVKDLFWIAEHMSLFNGVPAKDGAELALKASDILLSKLQNSFSDFEELYTDAENPSVNQQKEKLIPHIKQRISYAAALAAYRSGDKELAEKYFEDSFTLKGTEYFYKAKFARAEIALPEKAFEKARNDLSDVALTASASRKYGESLKARCLIGESFIAEENLQKAFSCFNVIVKTMKPRTVSENNITLNNTDENEWNERALYQSILCASKLEKKDDKAKLVDKYNSLFPDGKMKTEINNILNK